MVGKSVGLQVESVWYRRVGGGREPTSERPSQALRRSTRLTRSFSRSTRLRVQSKLEWEDYPARANTNEREGDEREKKNKTTRRRIDLLENDQCACLLSFSLFKSQLESDTPTAPPLLISSHQSPTGQQLHAS